MRGEPGRADTFLPVDVIRPPVWRRKIGAPLLFRDAWTSGALRNSAYHSTGSSNRSSQDGSETTGAEGREMG